jgi:ribosome-associated translation inhibitor RaiA
MKENKAKRLVDYGVEEVEKIAPDNSQIEVDVKEDPVGHYSSLIKIKAKHKIFFVKKESDSMYESFHKALRALRSQIAKKKMSHRIFRNVDFQG